MMGARRIVTAVCAAAVVLAGVLWWSNRDSSVTRASKTTAPDAGAPREAFDDKKPEFEAELRSFYNEFLHASDLHRTPDASARELGSGLADLAEPAVVAHYDAWRATNEAYGNGFQRVTEMSSTPNIVNFKVDGTQLTIRDCTAETRVMISKQQITHYVTRVVQVVSRGGLYRVASMRVEHEGLLESPGYGCIPNRMGKQATDAVETTLREFAAAQANPRPGLPPTLAAVVSGPLEAKLVSSLAEQTTRNISITSPAQRVVTTLGLDPRLTGVVAVVEACLTYPEGLVLRELSSGKVQREVFPAGSQHKITYAVRLGDPGGPAVYSVIDDDLPTKC